MSRVVTSEEYFRAIEEIDRIVIGHALDADFGYDMGMSDETYARLCQYEHIVELYEQQNPEMLEAMGEEEI